MTDLDRFSAFCKKLRLVTGEPLLLEPFQREMLADLFAGAAETLIVVPKKNGKTTLFAALALHHLTTTKDADCVVVANSSKQAMKLFDEARAFVQRSDELQSKVRVLRGYREIRLRDPEAPDDPKRFMGTIQVLAADADTADGWGGTLALIDELHRSKDAELYGVLRDGLGPRNGRMATISTAGAALDSPLGELRKQAHAFPDFSRLDARIKAVSEDGSFVLHEWCLEETDDLDDMEVVKRANPASWQTIDQLKRRHGSPSMTPWQWARFACGIWTEGERPWIEPASWDVLKDPGLVIPPKSSVWLGVDLGVRHDSTAIALVQPVGHEFNVEARIMAPTKDRPVRVEDVEAAIREIAEAYTVVGVVFDPWSFLRSAELLEAEGLLMVKHPMGPERMSLASQNLYRLIQEGRIHHDGGAALRAHVLAGVTKETERGWRLVKDPRMKRPIDALIALAIACSVATEPPKKRAEAIFI